MKCFICSAQFPNYLSLIRHKQESHPEELYPCPVCPYVCLSAGSLFKRHIRVLHKPYMYRGVTIDSLERDFLRRQGFNPQQIEPLMSEVRPPFRIAKRPRPQPTFPNAKRAECKRPLPQPTFPPAKRAELERPLSQHTSPPAKRAELKRSQIKPHKAVVATVPNPVRVEKSLPMIEDLHVDRGSDDSIGPDPGFTLCILDLQTVLDCPPDEPKEERPPRSSTPMPDANGSGFSYCGTPTLTSPNHSAESLMTVPNSPESIALATNERLLLGKEMVERAYVDNNIVVELIQRVWISEKVFDRIGGEWIPLKCISRRNVGAIIRDVMEKERENPKTKEDSF